MRPDCGCTLVQKTHEIATASNGNRIVIIRNPYDSFKSLRHLNACGGNHVGKAPANHFNGSSITLFMCLYWINYIQVYFKTDWDSFVQSQTFEWKEKMFHWIPNIRRGGVLHYEHFLHDLDGQLRKLVQYLNLQVDEQRLKCTLKHNFKTFQRNSTHESEHEK